MARRRRGAARWRSWPPRLLHPHWPPEWTPRSDRALRHGRQAHVPRGRSRRSLGSLLVRVRVRVGVGVGVGIGIGVGIGVGVGVGVEIGRAHV